MKTKIIPLFDKMLIEMGNADVGIIRNSTIKTEYGKVLAIGKDVKFFKVGDEILYKAWGIDEVVYKDGKKYCFMKENCEAVCAIIK